MGERDELTAFTTNSEFCFINVMNPPYKISEEAARKRGLPWTSEVVIANYDFVDQLMNLFPNHWSIYTHVYFLPVIIRTYHDSLGVS